MTESVYRRVLGVELDKLAPELRPYFDGGQRIGVGSGVFEVAGSPLRVLKPVLAFMAWQRIRIPALATVTVDESWSDGAQHVDVRLRTPLLGDWFRYAGHFTFSYESR